MSEEFESSLINRNDSSKLQSSFEQVPYHSIMARLDAGSQCINEFGRIISSNLENMQRNITFSSTLARTHIYNNEIPQSGTEKALGYFKNYHLFVAKQQVRYFKEMTDKILKSIEDTKSNRSEVSSKHKQAVKNATKDVSHAQEALEKAKNLYSKAVVELNAAKYKLQSLEGELEKFQEEKKSNFMGRMLIAFEVTPMQDRDKQAKRVRKRIEMVFECKRDIALKRKLLKEKIFIRDSAIAQATEAAQTLEYERIRFIKENLKTFLHLENELINTRQGLLSSLEDVIDSIQIEDDLQIFVQQEKKPEHTHKYSKAMDLLDWDYSKRCSAISQAEMQDLLSVNGKIIEYDTSMSRNDSEETVRLSTMPLDDNFEYKKTQILTFQSMDNALVGTKEANALNPESSSESSPLIAENRVDPNDNDIKAPDVQPNINSTLDISTNTLENVATYEEAAEKREIKDDLKQSQEITIANSVEVVYNDEKGLSRDDVEKYKSSICSALSVLFDSENNNLGELEDLSQFLTENKWKELLLLQQCRDMLLQELDNKRGTHSGLDRDRYRAMELAMKVVLDHCLNLLDRKTALRVVNMANTFHIKETSDVLTQTSEADQRRYLLKEETLRKHPIWQGKGFWEYCLMERISAQLQYSTPVLWDELPAESLREAVVNIHHIVFVQLVTIAFTMHEIGQPYEEVERTVLELSRGAQLVEEQEHDLLKSIRKTFSIESTRPSTPPTYETRLSNNDSNTAALELVNESEILSNQILSEVFKNETEIGDDNITISEKSTSAIAEQSDIFDDGLIRVSSIKSIMKLEERCVDVELVNPVLIDECILPDEDSIDEVQL